MKVCFVLQVWQSRRYYNVHYWEQSAVQCFASSLSPCQQHGLCCSMTEVN